MRRILLACAALALPLAAQAPQPLSTRVVAYQIEARLDAVKKTVDATETLTYRNLTGQPLSTFPFHLYLNAFQPKSSMQREEHRGDPEWEMKLTEYGATAILLPPDAPLTHGPAQDAGWCVASQSDLSVLMLRDCGS